jgi:PAS domain S-box-containing protein
LPQFKSFTKGEIPSNTFFTIRWLSKSGTYIWVEHLSMPVYDDFGNLVAVESIGRDITERKKVEEALKNSEQEKAAVLGGLKNGAVEYLDPQMRIIWVNEAVQKSLGLSVKEMQGKHCFELIEGLEAPCPGCTAVIACKTGEPQEGELVTPDGKTWLSCSNPLKDSMGQVTGVVHVAVNITKRKQIEKALRESEEKYRLLIDTANESVIVAQDGLFKFVNPMTLGLLGADSEQELIDRPFPEFIHPDDRSMVVENYRRRIANEAAQPRYAFRAATRDGIVKWVEINAALIEWQGKPATLNFLTDITERKRAEEALRKAHDELEMRVKERTEELARKNTEMERFIYTVSHDLRTPLISVSGFLGFIKQDAEQGDLDRMQADLRIANEAVTKMDRHLLETLELSRIGRVVNPPDDVPFGEIVEDALGQTSEKIRSSGCKVSVSENLPVVHVDRMRITEVLANLIENSIKYMGLQANPELEIGQRIDGKGRIFFVRDNGIGIDPSQHEKVFELFYKVDNKSEGSGAGLAIVKKIIEVHGGRIWIESELGQGCTVCFTLPIANVG